MAKKGDLSLNVIVIAILALLVLVVLAMIFTGRLAGFTKDVKSCASLKSAACVTDASECGGDDQKVMGGYTCPTETSVCCLSLIQPESEFG